MKIGILGGTFDPPHMGHIKLALAAIGRCGLDKLVLMPAANPPHKKSMTNPLHRRNMAALAAEEYGFELCEIEYARKTPSYTIDTLKELEKLYPDDKLYFIIGGDSMLDFEKWHEWNKLITRCAFIVGSRSVAQKEQVEKAVKDKTERFGAEIYVLDFLPEEVSSTEIRNGEVEEEVPEKVREYIEKNNLYKRF